LYYRAGKVGGRLVFYEIAEVRRQPVPVDEAALRQQWGHDFSPGANLRIGEVIGAPLGYSALAPFTGERQCRDTG